MQRDQNKGKINCCSNIKEQVFKYKNIFSLMIIWKSLLNK